MLSGLHTLEVKHTGFRDLVNQKYGALDQRVASTNQQIANAINAIALKLGPLPDREELEGIIDGAVVTGVQVLRMEIGTSQVILSNRLDQVADRGNSLDTSVNALRDEGAHTAALVSAMNPRLEATTAMTGTCLERITQLENNEIVHRLEHSELKNTQLEAEIRALTLKFTQLEARLHPFDSPVSVMALPSNLSDIPADSVPTRVPIYRGGRTTIESESDSDDVEDAQE